MKIFMFSLLVTIFMANTIVAQTDTTANQPEIIFAETTHEFGIIPYGGNGTYEYVFTNKGKVPLLITNCVKGCGCTSVTWTREPVLPGKTGSVIATYNTRIIGRFSKGVDVYSNTKTPKINLKLRGAVNEPETKAQTDTTGLGDGPVLTFEKLVYDLGNIPYNSSGTSQFVFTNTGKTTLKVINCVKGERIVSIEGNRQTVLSGQKSFITVTFNTQIAGAFNTRIIVYTNAKTPNVIHIKGRVEDTK